MFQILQGLLVERRTNLLLGFQYAKLLLTPWATRVIRTIVNPSSNLKLDLYDKNNLQIN